MSIITAISSTFLCCIGAVPSLPALFFFFNDTATTEIYTLSLHDALPISRCRRGPPWTRPHPLRPCCGVTASWQHGLSWLDRKSTRLNSSHVRISYAVFCLKKKKKNEKRSEVYRLQQRGMHVGRQTHEATR